MGTNYEALLGRGTGTAAPAAGSAGPAAGSSAKYEALLGRGGSTVNPVYAQPKAPALSAQDQKIVKSFNTLDAPTRQHAIDTLTAKANAGDQESARKLTYLTPIQSQNIPKAPDYVDHSLGGVLYRAQDPIISGIVGAVSGGNGGAASPSDNNLDTIPLKGGGTKIVGVQPMGDSQPTLRDQAIAGAGARFGGVINPMAVVKGVAGAFVKKGIETAAETAAKDVALNAAKTQTTNLAKALAFARAANHTGLQGAAFGASGAATSDNQYNSVGDAAKGIAGGAAMGYGTGAVLHGATAGAGAAIKGGAKSIAKYIDDPVQKAAAERVYQTIDPTATTKEYDAAVKAETKAINADKVQKGAILEAYKQGGVNAIDATTGKGKQALAAQYNAEATKAAPRYIKDLNEVGQSAGIPLAHAMTHNAVKEVPSILEKFDRKGSTARPTDLVRATLKLPKDAAPMADTHIQNVIEQMRQRGYDVYIDPKTGQPDITNRYTDPEPGYKDIALKFTHPSSPVVHELQMLQPEMQGVKATKAGHGIYDTLKAVQRWKAENGDHPEITKLEQSLNDMAKSRYQAAFEADNPSSMRPAETSVSNTAGSKGSPAFSDSEMTTLKGFLNNLSEPALANRAVSADIGERLSKVISEPPSKSTIAQEAPKVNEKTAPKVTTKSEVGKPRTLNEHAADPKVQAEATKAAGRKLLATAEKQGLASDHMAVKKAQYMIETGKSPDTPTGHELGFTAWLNKQDEQSAISAPKVSPEDQANAKIAMEQMAQERADMHRHMDSTQGTVHTIPGEDGAKLKATSNSPFYRDTYAKAKLVNGKGRPPTVAEYLAEAHRALSSGTDEESKMYQHAKSYADGKPIYSDVSEFIGKDGLPDNPTNDSTREHHFNEALRDTIKKIQDAPGYQSEMEARGGNAIKAHEETYAEAKRLGPVSDETLTNFKPGDPADTVTTTRAHATVEAAARVLDDLRTAGTDTTSPAFQDAAERFSKMLVGYKMMTAESGRSLNIQGTFVDTAIKLQEAVVKIEKETKGATPEARQKLIQTKIDEAERELNGGRTNKEKAAAIDAAKTAAEKTVPEGASKLERAAIIGKAVAKAEEVQATKFAKVKAATQSIMKMVAEFATSMKLTSPLTHAVNIGSNFLTLPVRTMENTVTWAQRAVKGEADASGAKYVFGAGTSWSAATHQFASDMKNAITSKGYDTPLAKGEVAPAIPGKVGHYIRTPFNFLSAADNFFKTLISSNQLHQEAYGIAFKEGFRGVELANRIHELVTSPTEEMKLKSDETAKEYTFNNESGPIAGGIIKILTKVPLGRLLIPFVKTPSNLASFQARRSAIGIFSPHNIQELAKGGASREEAISRLAVGTGMSVAGWVAVSQIGQDNIVGAAPAAPGDKDNFYNSGKKPYSIKIGQNWVQYNRFQPVGMYLTQAVNLRDALESGNSKTAGNIFTSMVVGTAKGIADLPFVSGVSNVIAALNDPTNQTAANKAIGGLVTGLIPNVLGDAASAMDNTQRAAKTITDQVKMKIPNTPLTSGFNRSQVAPRQNAFGEDQQNGGSPFQRGFVKIVGTDTSSPLEKQLLKLSAETQYNVTPPKAGTKVHGIVLSADQFDKYQNLSGQKFAARLTQAVNDSSFNNLGTDDKKKTLEQIVASSRADAANELLGKAAAKPYKPSLKKYK